MKFTLGTRSISHHVKSKLFKRDIDFACKQGIGPGTVTDIASRIAGSGTITNDHWEKAREERRSARSANFRIRYARVHVTNILQATANAVGGTLSATKHALETNHAMLVERKFALELHDRNLEDVLVQYAKDKVKITQSSGKYYQHKHVSLDFQELVANLHEQVNAYYSKSVGK